MNPELLSRSVISLLRGICYHPAKATWEPNDGRLRITFEPDGRDYHRVMGRDGCVIKGLQHIAKEIARSNGYMATIHLAKNFDGVIKEDREFEQKPEFKPDEIERIVGGLLASALNREVISRTRRSNDRLDIKVEAGDEDQSVITALGEAVYAYGYVQGCIIKLSTVPMEKPIGKVVCRGK